MQQTSWHSLATYERSESIWRLNCIHCRYRRVSLYQWCDWYSLIHSSIHSISHSLAKRLSCVWIMNGTLNSLDSTLFHWPFHVLLFSRFSHIPFYCWLCKCVCAFFYVNAFVCLFARLRFLTTLSHTDIHIHFNPKVLFWSRPSFIPTCFFFFVLSFCSVLSTSIFFLLLLLKFPLCEPPNATTYTHSYRSKE